MERALSVMKIILIFKDVSYLLKKLTYVTLPVRPPHFEFIQRKYFDHIRNEYHHIILQNIKLN